MKLNCSLSMDIEFAETSAEGVNGTSFFQILWFKWYRVNESIPVTLINFGCIKIYILNLVKKLFVFDKLLLNLKGICARNITIELVRSLSSWNFVIFNRVSDGKLYQSIANEIQAIQPKTHTTSLYYFVNWEKSDTTQIAYNFKVLNWHFALEGNLRDLTIIN